MLMEDFAMSDAGFVGDDEEMVDNDYDWDAPVMMQEDVLPSETNEVQEYDMIEEEVVAQPMENAGEMAVEQLEPLNVVPPPTTVATTTIEAIIPPPIAQPSISIPEASSIIQPEVAPPASHISPISTALPQELPLKPESPVNHSAPSSFNQVIAPPEASPSIAAPPTTETSTQVLPSSSSPRAETVEQAVIDPTPLPETQTLPEVVNVTENLPVISVDIVEGIEVKAHVDVPTVTDSQETVHVPNPHHVVLYYGEEVFSLFFESSDMPVLLQGQSHLYMAPLSQLLRTIKEREDERLQGVEGCVLGLEYQPLDLCIDENSKYADVYSLQDFCTAMESCNHTSMELTLYQVADFQFTLMERLKGIQPETAAADDSQDVPGQEQLGEVPEVGTEHSEEVAESHDQQAEPEAVHAAQAAPLVHDPNLEEAPAEPEELREGVDQVPTQDVPAEVNNDDSEESEYADKEDAEAEAEVEPAEEKGNATEEVASEEATSNVDGQAVEPNVDDDASTAPETDVNDGTEYANQQPDQDEGHPDQDLEAQSAHETESEGTLESSAHGEEPATAADDPIANWDEENDEESEEYSEQYDVTNDYGDGESASDAVHEPQVDQQNSSHDDASNATDGGASVPTHTTDLPEDFPDNDGVDEVDQTDALLDNAPPLPDEDDFDELAEYDDDNETTYGGEDFPVEGQELVNDGGSTTAIPSEQLPPKPDQPVRRNSTGKRTYAESEDAYEDQESPTSESYGEAKRPRVE